MTARVDSYTSISFECGVFSIAVDAVPIAVGLILSVILAIVGGITYTETLNHNLEMKKLECSTTVVPAREAGEGDLPIE